MILPENWPLPLSIIKDEEASFSPRQELGYRRIDEIPLEDRPSFYEIARFIVENSSIPERFYDDVIVWIENGFRNLPDWRQWLLKSKPASTEIAGFSLNSDGTIEEVEEEIDEDDEL